MTENWLKAINNGKIADTIMVDLRKAFDLIDPGLLLQKCLIINVLKLLLL